MDDARPSRRFARTALYLGGCLTLMALHLVPYDMIPGGWPTPELILSLTFAWILRRPDDLPAILIGAVFLIADLLLQKPPGLGAALAVAASEALRGRVWSGQPLSFGSEWAWAGGLSLIIAVAGWIGLGLTLAPRPELGMVLLGGLTTALSYPVTALALRLSGIRRPLMVSRIQSGGRA